MTQKVIDKKLITRTYWLLLLSCGHMYTRPIPISSTDRIKKRYICHSCKNQKDREARGARPNLRRRKNR